MGMRAWVQGDSASPVRGACSRGMVFTSPALPDTPQTLLRESSRPCFARDAANGASTDTQELPAPPILPWAHCGTEADGKVASVRVGIGMRCIPACATTAASQGPRHGSVPGEDQTGSTLSWRRSHACVAALVANCTGAASTHRRWGELEQGGSAGLFMTLLLRACAGGDDAAAAAWCAASCCSVYTCTITLLITTCKSYSCSSSAAGRRRLHLRQRNLALPPCNRPAQLSLVLYSTSIDRCCASSDGTACEGGVATPALLCLAD